ncbi:LysR family transcriptional regulator [Caballeronia sordidicola]|uniref:LysR family transcriptional regulator n=1 Tax=Caballeronia sordidicola TaxID=196367 RepID=UPI0004D00B70|nr:LysR family transcriptional regulator [Caballeronia sordidicola]HMC48025.1 LysR family transcriptional regulator [Caballeronia sp.]
MRHLPSLIALRFFEETARHLSFNRAARALCVTQGAVSRQIRLLEESLGVKLFERDHKGIRLTQAGVLLMPSVTEAFDVIERGTRHLTGTVERKRLIVSLPPTFATQWFSSRLGGLAEQLPDVDLSIRTQESDECHCSVRFGRDAAAHGWSELLMVERHALVGSASFTGMPVETLLDRLPALHVLHEDVRLNLWPDWLAKAGLPPRYAENGIEFSNLQQAIHAARRGVGLAVVDLNMIADELIEGDLVRISDVEISGPFGYWLDVPEAYRDVSTVTGFADWLRHEAALPV